jgi:hypothetical protein
MENKEEFKLAGKPWAYEEDQQLIKEYTVEKLNLLEICEIHKRKPGGITSRLKRLNLIDMRQDARGYSEYLESDLYKEIEEKKNRKENNAKSIESINNPIDNNQGKGMFGLDKSLYPSRMGQPWDEQEVTKLLKSVQKKKSVKEMAEAHQRTEGAITGKLKGLAADYYIYDKKTVEEIEKYTGLSQEAILEAVQKKQFRNSLTKRERKIITESESYEPSLKELMTVMKDIQYKMNIILEKIQ